MGYYIRILSPTDRRVSLAVLRTALAEDEVDAVIQVESGTDDDWEQISVSRRGGEPIALVERSSGDDLVAEEIEEFLEEVEEGKPKSAAAWLAEYLPGVITIHAIQFLDATSSESGMKAVHAIQSCLWGECGGILQADGEGFSNEQGYHALWQFDDDATGPWHMGVLRDGAWIHFEMDLGNTKHRKAFLRGEVPDGVNLAE